MTLHVNCDLLNLTQRLRAFSPFPSSTSLKIFASDILKLDFRIACTDSDDSNESVPNQSIYSPTVISIDIHDLFMRVLFCSNFFDVNSLFRRF